MSHPNEGPLPKPSKKTRLRTALGAGAILAALGGAYELGKNDQNPTVDIAQHVKDSATQVISAPINSGAQKPKENLVSEKLLRLLKNDLQEGWIDYDFVQNDFLGGVDPEDLMETPDKALKWLGDNKKRQEQMKELATQNKIGMAEVVHLKIISPERALEKIKKFKESGTEILISDEPHSIVPGEGLRFFNNMQKDNVAFFKHVYAEEPNYPYKAGGPEPKPTSL